VVGGGEKREWSGDRTGCGDQAQRSDAVCSVRPDSSPCNDPVELRDFCFARGTGGLSEAGDFLSGGFFAAGGYRGAVRGCVGRWS